MKAKDQIPSAYEVSDTSSQDRSQAGDRSHSSDNEKWLDSLEYLLGDVLRRKGSEQVNFLLEKLIDRFKGEQNHVASTIATPYVNTIPKAKQPTYPGNRDIERRIQIAEQHLQRFVATKLLCTVSHWGVSAITLSIIAVIGRVLIAMRFIITIFSR